jgi:hypothetical protein
MHSDSDILVITPILKKLKCDGETATSEGE